MKNLARVAVSAAAIALAAIRFVAIDAGSHSASDTLRPWLIQVAIIVVVAALAWLAIDRLAARGSATRR